MKKALLSVAMAAVISLSATAVSSTVVGAVSSNLATPKISKTENVNGGVKISWNKVNKAEVYRVYYKGSKGWTRLADTTSTSYTDSKVASGKTYTYTVRCLNKSKNKFTSGYDSKGAKATFIAAPKISKTENVNGGVKISWGKSNGAEKYRVYYKGSKGWTRMVDTTSTSYIDKDVSSGKNYTYTVRCVNSSATKFTSGYDSKGKSIKYVSAPKISRTEATYNSITLNWDNVNGAEKYRVYRRGEKGWSRLFDTTSTTFTDTNLYADTEYTYTVRCINSSANKFTSGYNSKGFTVTTLSAPAEHTHSWQNITKETKVKVVDKEAYTYEEPVYEKHDRTICNRCGADITDNLEHIFECNSNYHNEWRDIQVGTKTVTVPEKSHYETKTKVVGRKCTVCGKVEMFSEEHTHTWQNVTKETKVKIVDQKAYTYEEPIYEEQIRTICKVCGADITGFASEHNEQHALNGEPVSYKAERREIQTGTKTITVPEKSHYETKTEVVGRKCTECGEIEYY
mgnify:CR=1 FL=1